SVGSGAIGPSHLQVSVEQLRRRVRHSATDAGDCYASGLLAYASAPAGAWCSARGESVLADVPGGDAGNAAVSGIREVGPAQLLRWVDPGELDLNRAVRAAADEA